MIVGAGPLHHREDRHMIGDLHSFLESRREVVVVAPIEHAVGVAVDGGVAANATRNGTARCRSPAITRAAV